MMGPGLADWLVWTIILLGLLALLLIDLTHDGLVARLDDQLFNWFVHRPTSRFWRLVATLGTPWLIVVYVLALALSRLVLGHWQECIWVLGILGGGNLLGIFTKHALKRERPAGHTAGAGDYSFPSGHVLGASLLALMVLSLWPRPGVALLTGFLWLLVAGSRLFLRAHHPSDLAGTVLFAGAWFILFTRLCCWLFSVTF